MGSSNVTLLNLYFQNYGNKKKMEDLHQKKVQMYLQLS